MQSSLSNDIIPEDFKRKGIRVADAFSFRIFSCAFAKVLFPYNSG
jgi:hypothetical protein